MAICQLAAQVIADRQACAKQQQGDGHQLIAHLRDLGQQRLYIGVEGKHPGKAKHRNAQTQPDLRILGHGQFFAQRGVAWCRNLAWHKPGQDGQGQRTNQRHHHK